MSIKVMSVVWEQSKAEGGTLLVLLALADYADDHGTCWPSVAAIGRKARLSERQVQYAVQRLCATGELLVERNAGPGLRDDRRVNRYEVQTLRLVESRGAMGGSHGVQSATSTGCNGLHPNRQRDPLVEPSERTCALGDGFDIFWDAYPKKAAKLAAQKAWRVGRGRRPPLPALLAALERAKGSVQWKEGVIPHAATWLNGRRWDDEQEKPAWEVTAERLRGVT